ncbi:MAG: helix-turn-helix domain-containing protein [Bdellovibrionales bacterium]
MARTLFIVVSDDSDIISKARSWGVQNNVTVNAYSSNQWSEGLNNPGFRAQVQTETVALTGGKVYNFPNSAPSAVDKNVQTMNQLESDAIINAIAQYKGNLTEAARALGIGRATIYRKIKQYNIDPNGARGKGLVAA